MTCRLLRVIIPASASLSVNQAGCAKAAKRIEVLFGVETSGDPRNIVLDGGSPSHTARGKFRWSLCHITLTACLLTYWHRFVVRLTICSVLFFSSPRSEGWPHRVDVLSPFVPVLCHSDWLVQLLDHPSTSAASSDYWWWSGVKEGTLTQLL